MTSPCIPPMLGVLSHDIILVCDASGMVQEANTLAQRMFGADLIGSMLEQLLSEHAAEKGAAFLQQLGELAPGAVGPAWELLFHVPNSTPLPISMRGGNMSPDAWMLVGACEPPQLTSIYHEVLAINSELTNLIRQLSKEHARLAEQVGRLLDAQEGRTYDNQR